MFFRKLSATVLLLTVIFATGFNFKPNVPPRCSCKEDRQLALKKPYISGIDVKEIQLQLQNFGFYKGEIDGIYGPETAGAVKLFQKKYGLLADGIFGYRTYSKLAELFDLPVSLEPTAPPPGEVIIFIDTSERKLIILSDGKPYKEYPVAVGKWHTPTPLGTWKITQKAAWGEGFGSRWMRINVPWGTYGIHGTNKPWSIGSYASAGCIRMHNRHVEEIYRWVSTGTPVIIVGGPYGPFTSGFRTLVKGEKGSDVMEVQKKLKLLGYYDGSIDGIFGWGMEKAVKQFQKDKKIPITGQVTKRVYDELEIIRFE